MAGSFNHLVSETGEFHADLVENRRDCVEALAECWDIIIAMTGGDVAEINTYLKALNYPTVDKASTLLPSRVERLPNGSLRVLRSGEGV